MSEITSGNKEQNRIIAGIADAKQQLTQDAMASTASLLNYYYSVLKAPLIIRKVSPTRCPNPYEEILRNCDGKHIVPGALIGVDLPGCLTYDGPDWVNAAGLVFISQTIVAAFAVPANSDRLKGVLFSNPTTIGEYLRDRGGKPCYSFEAIVNKMRFRSERANCIVKDESKLDVINTYIFERKRGKLPLEINFSDRNKDYHLNEFSEFLKQYITQNYQHLFKPEEIATDFYLYTLIRAKFNKLLTDAFKARAISLLALPAFAKNKNAHYMGQLFIPKFCLNLIWQHVKNLMPNQPQIKLGCAAKC